MVYNNITDYLEAKTNWEQQHIIIQNGLITVNGRSYTPAEFYKNNPRPTFEPPINENNPGKPSVASGCKTRKK